MEASIVEKKDYINKVKMAEPKTGVLFRDFISDTLKKKYKIAQNLLPVIKLQNYKQFISKYEQILFLKILFQQVPKVKQLIKNNLLNFYVRIICNKLMFR